jgi:hypothetical protein
MTHEPMLAKPRRGRGLARLAAASCWLLWTACGDAADATAGMAGAAAHGGTTAGAAGHAGDSSPAPRSSACAEPVTPSTPRSVADVIAMLNAMPKPVTLPCFVESLAHPLSVQATRSVLSAQPADGTRSPRVFLFLEPLIASVVPDGLGRHLLELGEQRSDTHSLKAELEFPITSELDAASPFARLRYDDRLSTCDFCHADPSPAPDLEIPYALVSQAMRPLQRERVPVDTLIAEDAACDEAHEPERCAMLRALLGETPPSETEFPSTYRTFVP